MSPFECPSIAAFCFKFKIECLDMHGCSVAGFCNTLAKFDNATEDVL
jgi:hypothetical protein